MGRHCQSRATGGGQWSNRLHGKLLRNNHSPVTGQLRRARPEPAGISQLQFPKPVRWGAEDQQRNRSATQVLLIGDGLIGGDKYLEAATSAAVSSAPFLKPVNPAYRAV